jgi:tetratricopeptide (TPR) repeat protein
MVRARDDGARLGAARALVARFRTAGELHRRGHAWVKGDLLPAIGRLAATTRRVDRQTAARVFFLLGELHELNGAPRAAVRAYQHAAALSLSGKEVGAAAWREMAGAFENMGLYKRARHALERARALDPADELALADLDRVEWALFHDCPPLYDDKSAAWRSLEAIAAGRYRQALVLAGGDAGLRARQLRARAHGARGDARAVVAEWQGVAGTRGPVQLQLADWYYTFQGAAADDPELWRLLLWKIRPRVEGGSFNYPETLWDLDVTAAKRFELFVRFQLARAARDDRALLSLAASYPSWREPGELVLRLRSGPRGAGGRRARP